MAKPANKFNFGEALRAYGAANTSSVEGYLEIAGNRLHYRPMWTSIGSAAALTLCGIAGMALAARGRSPATLFFVAALAIVTLSALLDLAMASGAAGLNGSRLLLDWLSLRVAGLSLALAALSGVAFSLPPRLNLMVSVMGLIAIIAFAGGFVPTLGLPVGYVLAGILLFAVLAGWRNKKRAASWLLFGLIAAALADVVRISGFQIGPLTTSALINLALAPALIGFGLSARAAR